MNVKCHCKAPASHPPSVSDFGISSRTFSGIFGPKLGKARKIRSPLVTITNKLMALTQCVIRIARGCS